MFANLPNEESPLSSDPDLQGRFLRSKKGTSSISRSRGGNKSVSVSKTKASSIGGRIMPLINQLIPTVMFL